MGTATKHLVASSHRRATDAGLAMLRAGGNAADAFVAAMLVEDVVLPGVTSTAGLAGILVYSAKTKQISYLHGGLADPVAADRRWKPTDAATGKLVLVPGAPAAYAELARRFGTRPLSALVEPAAKIASDGFPLDALYARAIIGHRAQLEASPFGKATFFHEGKPLAEGETLREREFGASLRSFGKDPTFFHMGPWAREAVKLVNARGGSLEAQDFSSYALETTEPLRGHFVGNDVYTGGQGGERSLVSLEALALLRGSAPAVAPSASAPAAETILRILDAVIRLPPLAGKSIETAAAGVAATVRQGGPRPKDDDEHEGGSHSSSVVVVDDAGNVVVGTHTIETLNWGEGLFVGGIPLSTSASINADAKAPTRMRRDPLTSTIVMKEGVPTVALAVYGSGLFPADVQLLDAVLSRGKNPEEAVLEPRIGYYAVDFAHMTMDMGKNGVDPRFAPEILCTLRAHGFATARSSPPLPPGIVDTGFPTLVTIAPGKLQGMTPDPFFIEGVAAGD